MKEFIHFL